MINFEMYVDRIVKQFFAFICVFLLVKTFLGEDTQVLIGYIGLLFMLFFAWQAGPISILFGLLNWLPSQFLPYQPRPLLQIASSAFVWSLINKIWLYSVGYNLPLVAWIISLIWMLIYIKNQYYALNDMALRLAQSELWGIIISAIYVLIFVQFNWY